jgi:hypothetical protein
MRTTLSISVAAILTAACGPKPSANDDTADDTGDDTPDADTTNPQFPDAAHCDKMDVLFVVDNSGSMGQEQTNLATNFPIFIQVLNESGLDYRVGVTSTGRNYTYQMATPIGNIPQTQDGGDDGRLLHPAGCNMSHAWIEKADPDPAAEFSCAANLGTDGPSDEMPLSAMRDAFEERLADGTNAGFLRPDALLAIVILTDENDCSYEHEVTLGFTEVLCESQMEPVANYVAFLDTLTGSRQKWATAVIAGPGPGACSSALGDADEATRLVDFVGQTGANAVISSICEGDLSVGLRDALATFSSACASFPPIE